MELRGRVLQFVLDAFTQIQEEYKFGQTREVKNQFHFHSVQPHLIYFRLYRHGVFTSLILEME